MSVLSSLGDAYHEYAASVLAGNDFKRSSFGAGFPLFAGAMYCNLLFHFCRIRYVYVHLPRSHVE